MYSPFQRVINSFVYRLVARKLKFLQAEERLMDGEIRSVEVASPENAEQLNGIWNPARFWGNYTTKPIVLFTVRQGFLSQEGVVYKGFRILREALVYENFEKKFAKDYLFRERSKKTIHVKEIYLVWDHWSPGNYFHWLLDTLPRIMALMQSEKQAKIVLALPQNIPPFARESLNLFPEMQALYFSERERIQAGLLHVVSYPASSGLAHPGYLQALRNAILNEAESRCDLHHPSGMKRVYISRQRAAQRKISNEQDLLQILDPEGFCTIYTEELGFWEQVKLAFYADIIIAPHGAGLANILFMKPGSRVVEVNQPDIDNATLCYWNLAKNLDLMYYYIPTVQDSEKNYHFSEDNLKQLNIILSPNE